MGPASASDGRRRGVPGAGGISGLELTAVVIGGGQLWLRGGCCVRIELSGSACEAASAQRATTTQKGNVAWKLSWKDSSASWNLNSSDA